MQWAAFYYKKEKGCFANKARYLRYLTIVCRVVFVFSKEASNAFSPGGQGSLTDFVCLRLPLPEHGVSRELGRVSILCPVSPDFLSRSAITKLTLLMRKP